MSNPPALSRGITTYTLFKLHNHKCVTKHRHIAEQKNTLAGSGPTKRKPRHGNHLSIPYSQINILVVNGPLPQTGQSMGNRGHNATKKPIGFAK